MGRTGQKTHSTTVSKRGVTGEGRPPHVPTQTDRDTVAVMVAGGISQADIARARGISERTLRNHYKDEIEAGATKLNTVVMIEWIKRIKAGEFAAIKWWTQSRMGMNEKFVIDDPSRDQPLRVTVELVGQAPAQPAKPVLDVEPARGTMRVPGSVVQLKG
jgi:hypothetical protein